MSRLDELRRIADIIGIATRHVDALGVVHEPGEETLARLIAALGLPAEAAEAAAALAEERSAGFGLGAAAIVPAAAAGLNVMLPPGTAVGWSCRLEDGSQR